MQSMLLLHKKKSYPIHNRSIYATYLVLYHKISTRIHDISQADKVYLYKTKICMGCSEVSKFEPKMWPKKGL